MSPLRRPSPDGRATKVIQAITGDRVTLRHPTADLGASASTFMSVLFDNTPYHLLSRPPSAHPDASMITGEYQLNGHTVRVRERVDQLDMKAAGVVFENTLVGTGGYLSVNSHRHHAEGVELLAMLDPTDTPLGFRITPGPGIRVLAAPQVILEVPGLGLLNIRPLTPEHVALLPEWQGTPVAGGEMYAASLTRTEPYLMLVTPTAHVSALLFDFSDLDASADVMAQMHVEWKRE